MNNGFWKGDALALTLEQSAQAGKHLRDVNELGEVIEELKRARKNLIDDVSANLAEKYALREALKKLDPKHPLLTNADLRSRIHEAGKRATLIANDFEGARQAGATFKY